MSNWREDSDRPRKKSSKMPIVRRPPTSSADGVEPSVGNSGTWRGKSKKESAATGNAAGAPSRTWTSQTKPVEVGPLRKLLIVLTLGICIAGLTGYFVWIVLRTDPKVPFFVSMTSTHRDPYFGESPFGQETAKHLLAISKTIQKNIRLMSHAGSLSSLESIEDIQGADQILNDLFNGQKFTARNLLPSNDIGDSERKRWFGSNDKLRGGGPGKNIVGFFISCLVSRSFDAQGNEEAVFLLNDSRSLSSERMLTATRLFESIAETIDSGSYAWVTLDCKSPSVITNFQDLQPPIELIEVAWKNLKPETQNRLIVTLPCAAGEQNNVAPELGSTTFAHMFLQGIHTGFHEGSGGAVSLKQFQEGLNRTVSSWVAIHRESAQHPFLLLPSTIADRPEAVVLYSTAQNAPLPTLTNTSGIRSEDFDWCDQRWSRLSRIGHLSNRHPLVFARVEASLIQLEDLAEFSADTKSGNLRERLRTSCEEDIRYLESLSQLPRVSLMETRSMQSATTKEEWKLDKQDWLLSLSRNNATPGTDLPESNVLAWDSDRKAQAFWAQLEESLNASNPATRRLQMNRRDLEQQLKQIGDASSVDWLEIQLVRNLLSDLDWEDPSKDTSSFATHFLKAFAAIQQLQCDPSHEVVGWFASKSRQAHQLLLNIYDGYTSTTLSDAESVARLQQLQKSVQVLGLTRSNLSQAIEMRDTSLRMAPHLMSFWARQYLTGSEDWARTCLEREREIGFLVAHAVEMAQMLESEDKEVLPKNFDSLLSDLRQSYESCLSSPTNSLNSRIATIEKSDPKDQESVRMRRDLLRWPLLPVRLRNRFHQDLQQFYSQAKTTSVTGGESKYQGRSLAPLFVELKDSFSATKRQSQLLDILRYNAIGNLPLAFQFMHTPGTSQSLYQSRLQCLPLAGALGHRTAGLVSEERRVAGLDTSDPAWTSPYLFFREQQCRYYQSQQVNLLEARWGNGSMDSKSPNDLYFVKLVDRYRVFIDGINDEVWLSAIPGSLKESKRTIESLQAKAIESVLSLKIQPETLARNKFTNGDRMDSYIAWNNTGIKQWVSIYLGSRSDSFPYRTTSWQAPPSIVPLRFGDESKTKMKVELPKVFLANNSDSSLADSWVLSFRGHYRIHTIPLSTPGEMIAIDFQKRPASNASVQVKASEIPPTKIFVLLDCSGSMTEGWNGMGEAKQAVVQLLEHLEDITNNGGAVFDISVVLFGFSLKSSGNEKFDSVWATVSPKIFDKNYGEQLQQTRGKFTSRNTKPICDSLRSTDWDEMRIGGRTPLYNAMLFAADQLNGSMLPTPRIIVLTDGENNPPGDRGVDTTPQQVVDALGGANKKARVQIYFADKKEKLEPDTAKELRLFLQNESDLKPITEFNDVGRQLVESIPKSNVVLLAKDGSLIAEGSFQQELVVDPELLPLDGSVEVRSYLQTGVAIQKKWNVRLTENERLRFEYNGIKGDLRPINFEKDTADGLVEPGRRNDFPIELQTEDESTLPYVVRGRYWLGREKIRKLSLQATMMGVKPDKETTQLFNRFPLVLSRVTPIQTTIPTIPFLLGHWNYEPTHYPVFTSPGIPWNALTKDNQRQLLSKEIQWDLWCYEGIPKEAILITVSPTGTTDVKPPSDVRIVRDDRDIRVRTTPRLENRYFVMGSLHPEISWSSTHRHEMHLLNHPTEAEIESVEEEYVFPATEGVPFRLLLIPMAAVEAPSGTLQPIHFHTRRSLPIQP